jgi:hypothetical protein
LFVLECLALSIESLFKVLSGHTVMLKCEFRETLLFECGLLLLAFNVLGPFPNLCVNLR